MKNLKRDGFEQYREWGVGFLTALRSVRNLICIGFIGTPAGR